MRSITHCLMPVLTLLMARAFEELY
jgi:hypothetical protein